jgi:small conductance mechanosensitive channel
MTGSTFALPVMSGLGDLGGAIDTSGVSGTDVLAAVMVAIATVAVAWLVGRFTRGRLTRPETGSLQVAALAARAARWIVVFVGAAWLLSLLGASANWFAITLAPVGVLIVLIAKPMLEKFAAGVALTTRPAFSIGDDIGVKDFKGTVLEITGRSTVLRLRDGRRAHVPNTDVVGETIVVYTTDQKRRTSVDLEIDARHPVAAVETVLLDALAGAEAVASDPPPRVRARGFGNAASPSVRFWHDSGLAAEGEALDQAVRAMSDALREAGMALASGSLVVDLQTGNPAEPPLTP